LHLFELLLTAIGLSMDAFAVAICQGLSMRKIRWRDAALIALFFGGFQAIMPLLGWLLASQFASAIQQIDHWVAFILLVIIGGNMIRESREPETNATCQNDDRIQIKRLLVLAVATSIDALAVGVTFAFLSVAIIPAVAIIGITTFDLSLVGVYVGTLWGAKFKGRAEVTGGVILILIGTKILLQHKGFIP
jgi:putative Mn2+ efflux pump MntP